MNVKDGGAVWPGCESLLASDGKGGAAMVSSVIGASVPRVEGAAKVTGGATYTADVKLPVMLWAKVLRSPSPHARIVSIDTSAARQVPGVVAVLTGADVE